MVAWRAFLTKDLQLSSPPLRANSMTPTALHCTLMVLKAACTNDPCYVDRFLSLFLKVGVS